MSLIKLLVNKKMPPEKTFFLSLIQNRDVSILFQPILDLANGDIFGIEALCRGPVNTKYFDPINLLTSAENVGLLYPLESMIRENSIRKFSGLGLSAKLFLNLTPKIVNEPEFAKGQTRRLVKHLGLKPCQVVFEITERSSIKDFASFRKALEHYREQGFLVAVDDAGAGYSSLQAIAELHPDFIKVDMSLIRNIESNPTKKALLETFVTFAGKINSSLIAEGIETEQELKTIKNLGITFGQGYLLGKPQPEPPWPEVPLTQTHFMTVTANRDLAPIISFVPTISKNSLIEDAVSFFYNNENCPAIVVTEGKKPLGIVVRNHLFKILGPQDETSQFLYQPVTTVMDSYAFIIKSSLSLSVICQLITYKADARLNDWVIVTEDDLVLGVIPVSLLFSTYINQTIKSSRY